MADTAERVALVTGASRGIGAGILEGLLGVGYTVVGTSTSEAGAAGVTEAITAAGGRGAGVVLDVADPEQITAVLKQIAAEHGAPAVLVNNAGIAEDDLLMRTDSASFDRVINTNLGAAFRLSKACVRGMMRARWGRIISISSVIARMGNGGQSVYAASKAGIEGFTRSLARELGSRNITVNAVAPGFIETDMTAAISEERKDDLISAVALGRLGSVADVTSAVVFLASDGAGYVTGETIHVNGGMYMA